MTERRIEYLRVDAVQPATRNPKRHSAADLGASISRFGFTEPPLLDERTGRLIAGHGRLESLTARHAAGDAPPDGITVDADGGWMLPVVRGWASRSDADAEAALVASNRVGEAGGWDERGLADLLGEYQADDSWLVGTGYTTGDVAALLAPRDEPPIDDEPPPPPADPPERDVHHAVLVDHLTAAGQSELLARLKGEGYKARAMTS